MFRTPKTSCGKTLFLTSSDPVLLLLLSRRHSYPAHLFTPSIKTNSTANDAKLIGDILELTQSNNAKDSTTCSSRYHSLRTTRMSILTHTCSGRPPLNSISSQPSTSSAGRTTANSHGSLASTHRWEPWELTLLRIIVELS